MERDKLIQKYEDIAKYLRNSDWIVGTPTWRWEVSLLNSEPVFHARAWVDGINIAFTIIRVEGKKNIAVAKGDYGDLMRYLAHGEGVIWSAVDLDDDAAGIAYKLEENFIRRLRIKFVVLESRKELQDKTNSEQRAIADDLVTSCHLVLHDIHDPNSFVIRQSKAGEGLYITGEVRSDCTKLELTLSHEAAKEVLIFLEGLTGNAEKAR